MNEQDYISKVENFLSVNNFKEINNNPLSTFALKTETYFNLCQDLIKKHNGHKGLLISNPRLPRLYGLPKIHKLGTPIRPVVSFTQTPVSKLSVFLNNLLNNLIKEKPRFCLKNSVDLIKKLNNLTLSEDSLLVSFDVCNLFTSIPRMETIPIISHLLTLNNVSNDDKIDIITLLKFCLSQDFFIFNNKIYEQPSGLAMGNPLSPLLADIFLDNLEKSLIPKLIEDAKIIKWFRYVDDCFVIVRGGEDEALDILNTLNSLHPSIKFTLEFENQNELNFLDLTIIKTTNSLSFKIYRKPTQTDHIISAHSNHPFQHKMASIYCYVYRLLNVPMNDIHYNNEVNILKQIVVNNGYDHTIIDKYIRKIKNKQEVSTAYATLSVNEQQLGKFYSLPYLGEFSKNIKKILSNTFQNVKISFKSINQLSSHLVNNKQKIPHTQKSGVYKLSCPQCSSTYIGKTVRPLFTRIREHLSKPQTSVFGHHITFTKHNFSPQRNSKILYQFGDRNSKVLDYREDLEIDRESRINDHCLNIRMNVTNSRYPIFKLFPQSN